MAVFLRRASRRDCEAVIGDIRPADEAELVASDGDARMAVIKGWLASPSYCWAGYDERGRTLGVFGVYAESCDERGRTLGVFGVYAESWYWSCPWLVGTRALESRRREFAALSFRVFPRVRARFPNMRNFVDARNSASIAWLSKLGFTMGAPVERGPYGLPFIPFWIGGGDECVIR